jgi:hypothetical protein
MDTTISDRPARAAASRATLGDLAGWALLAVAMLAFGFWNLAGPPLWWDEGWTLSVARNWLELGHYGRLRDQAPVRGGLEAAYTVTLPVALAMHVIGVGVWQGRIFGVVSAAAAVLLLAALASRLYGRRIAWATVGVALLMAMQPRLHPLLLGREVLGEMPMLAYLLAGYLCLLRALAGPHALLAPAILLLGLAWVSKAQVAPFLVLSLALPTLLALWARRWGVAATLGLALIGTYLAAAILRWVGVALLVNPALPADAVSGVTGMVALVFTPFNRAYALLSLLLLGMPTVLGLLWALRELWRGRAKTNTADKAEAASWYTRLVLVLFVGSWTAWYTLLSAGVARYLAPATFVGSIFAAAMLHSLMGGFSPGATMARIGELLARRPSRTAWGALAALFLIVWGVTITGMILAVNYPKDDRSAQRTADFLNALPADILIETYESELHFLLHRPYTFPPDQTHVELGRRSLLGEAVTVAYDPLAADPDYLVVGRFARENDLYAPVIAAGHFRLLREDGLYELYARVR